jgi:hypothetical protein
MQQKSWFHWAFKGASPMPDGFIMRLWCEGMIHSVRATPVSALTLLPPPYSTVFARKTRSKPDIVFKNKPDVVNASGS